MKKFLLVLIFTALCFASRTKANSNMGMFITYEYTGNGNDYIFKMRYHNGCLGVQFTSMMLSFKSSCFPDFNVTLPLVSSNAIEINWCQGSGFDACTPANLWNYGYMEYYFAGIANVPPCADWIVSATMCCRNDFCSNLFQPYFNDIYVETRFDNLNFPGNSSPYFNSVPVNYYCANIPAIADYSAYDIDGDSLHYEFVPVLRDSGIAVPMMPGFNYDQPISGSTLSYLDPGSGMMMFTPSVIQQSAIGIRLSEYRNNVLIGSVMLDQTIHVPTAVSSSDTITGRVFIDENGNGIFDINDKAISNLPVDLSIGSPGENTAFTLGNGKYEFYTTNDYWYLTIPNPPQYTQVNPTIIYVDTYPITNSYNNDFIVQPIPGINDLEINLNQLQRPVAGEAYPLQMVFNNSGTVSQTNIDVTLTLDPVLQFVSASIPPDNIAGNTLTWTIPSLSYFTGDNISVETTVDLQAATGTQIYSTATISSVSNDVTPVNNTDFIDDAVAIVNVSNYKEVIPSGNLDLTFVANQDWLTYRIYFQNTGSVPVQTVRIADMLDYDLEVSSIEVVSSSFPCTMTLGTPDLVGFTFSGINLPNSGSGFVEYRIKPKSSLSAGMYITNNAGIHFDFNAPVYTNVVQNRIVTSVGLEENADYDNEITVYPVPANDYCILEIITSESGDTEIEIFNMMGQLVKSRKQQLISGVNRINIPVEDLASGNYFISISSLHRRYVSKLVILR